MAVNLLFFINGDSTGIRKEMDDVAKSGKKVGEDFGRNLGRSALAQIRAYIGVTAILRLFLDAFRGGERITKEAAKHKVSPETFQMAEQKAEEEGKSVEDVIKGYQERLKTEKGALELEGERADLLARGKILSDEQVASLALMERKRESLKMGTAAAVAEVGTQIERSPLEVPMRLAAPGLSMVTSPEVWKKMQSDLEKLVKIGAELVGITKEGL